MIANIDSDDEIPFCKGSVPFRKLREATQAIDSIEHTRRNIAVFRTVGGQVVSLRKF